MKLVSVCSPTLGKKENKWISPNVSFWFILLLINRKKGLEIGSNKVAARLLGQIMCFQLQYFLFV